MTTYKHVRFLGLTLLLSTLPKCWSQSMPSFVVYQQIGDSQIWPESPNVDLLEDSSGGETILRWNAGYNSYHTALIKRSNYKLNLYCQCSTNTVQHVVFYFLSSTGSAATGEQSLKVEYSTAQTTNWPVFTREQAQTVDINFNSTNGAHATVLFNLNDDIDMSGTFRCELTVVGGVKLQSNVLYVTDIRKAVDMLNVPVLIGSARLYTSGVGVFQSVLSNHIPYINQMRNYINLNLDWSIGIQDTSIFGSPTYSKGSGSQYFNPAAKMDASDLGKYHISQNGTLYVTMESSVGQLIRNNLMSQSGLSKNQKSILLLSDASSLVADKFYIKPDSLSGASSFSVPFIVEPTSPNFPKITFVNNNDHTMKCGFLSSSTPINIDWSKDGRLLSASEMQGYGIQISNALNVLDLRGVVVSAAGLWQCSVRGTNIQTSYQLTVLRYPTFTLPNSPAAVIYATEGATVTISCAASSWDITNTASSPQIYINNILFSDLCSKTQPTNVALCDIKQYMSVDSSTTTTNGSSISDTSSTSYTISNLKFRSVSTNAFLSHIVSCKAQGTYLNQNQQQITISSTVSSSITIVPKLTQSQFKTLDLSQCSQTGCPINQNPIIFHCELNEEYVVSVQSTGAVIRQYWKIGSYADRDIMALTDSNSPLKNYTVFSNDGKNLTILPITSMDVLNAFNNLGNLTCVIEFHYPHFINSADLTNLKINGSGLVQPDIRSNIMGPMFYTSEKDSSLQGLNIMLSLGNPQAAIASATVGIIVGVILAIILILVIIVIIYFRCRKTATDYHMSEKEIAQGRNPVKEFENNIGFKNYDGDYQNQVDGKPTTLKPAQEDEVRLMSLNGGSALSGSEEGSDILDQYGEPETGRFMEDGSFINNYNAEPKQLPVNLKKLPPTRPVIEGKPFQYANIGSSLQKTPSFQGSMV